MCGSPLNLNDHSTSIRPGPRIMKHHTNFFSLMLLPVLRSNYIRCSMVFFVISTHRLPIYSFTANQIALHMFY